ncbi:hypothetical protein [Microcystis phage Mwe-JY25]
MSARPFIITESMVDAAIRAEIAELRQSSDLDASQCPVWPDDWAEQDRAAMRAVTRAGIAAALRAATAMPAPPSAEAVMAASDVLDRLAADALAAASAMGATSWIASGGGMVIEATSEGLRFRRMADMLAGAAAIVREIAGGKTP